MRGMAIISALLAICVVTPIWFYLLFQILSAIDASELTWFLFWAYMPVAIFVQVVAKILEGSK